jgi:hypothetical protein
MLVTPAGQVQVPLEVKVACLRPEEDAGGEGFHLLFALSYVKTSPSLGAVVEISLP